MNKQILWIWLRLALDGNSKMMFALYQVAGDIESIYRADKAQYQAWGLPERYLKALTDKDTARAYNIWGLCEKFGYHIVTIDEDGFPPLLRNIALPPCMLFYDGNLPSVLEFPALTMIGTRHSTTTGEACAAEMARGLSLSGFTIVCGVAEGIESVIHKAVTEVDGRCILMLPCGLEKVGKRVSHLIRDAVGKGAVVTEMLPHEAPGFNAYQMRNRLLSGISVGTFVVQAPKRSGALMTAGYAVNQGRDVFAVPGSVRDPSFAGNNELLRDGAQPVIEYDDIVQYYLPKYPGKLRELSEKDAVFESFAASLIEGTKNEFQSEAQQAIYSVLSDTPQFMEEIAVKTGLPIQKVMTELSLMEFSGWVEAAPGGSYKIIS